MKKVVSTLIVAGLLSGGAFSSAQALGTKTAFSLNLGVKTNLASGDSFDSIFFTLDARLGIALGPTMEISPEIMASVEDSLNFEYVWLSPGLMANFKFGDYFFGVGVVLPVIIEEGDPYTSSPAPKINVGYRSGNFILTGYIFTWTEDYDFFELNFIGVTVGYRF